MWTIIWTFIKPYVSNVYVWAGIALCVALAVQTGRCHIKDLKIEAVTVKLDAANERLASQKAELEKLKALADAQDKKLAQAYKENAEIAKAHARNIEAIIKSELPDSASCEDTAKWAKEIAKRRRQ